jgi:hypothetical protein
MNTVVFWWVSKFGGSLVVTSFRTPPRRGWFAAGCAA